MPVRCLCANGHGLRPPSVAAGGKKGFPPPYPLLPQNPHTGKANGIAHGDTVCAQRKWLRHVFRYCLPRNRKASQGHAAGMALFFHVTALSGGEAFPCFAESHRKAARERHVRCNRTNRGIAHSALLPSSKPPSPPYAHERYRHHDRPCPLPPGPAPAAGQLPFRRGRPAAGGLRGGKPCLPAGNGPPEGGGAWQRLRCGPAGPVPVSLVRHGRSTAIRQTRCPANAPARSLQKHPPLPLAGSRREKPLTCTLWGWSRTRPYALRPRQTPAFWGWKMCAATGRAP